MPEVTFALQSLTAPTLNVTVPVVDFEKPLAKRSGAWRSVTVVGVAFTTKVVAPAATVTCTDADPGPTVPEPEYVPETVTCPRLRFTLIEHVAVPDST